MMNRLLFLSLALAFLVTVSLCGQCIDADTANECWQRFLPAPSAAGINTGVSGASTPTASALQDFLSIFAMTFDTASVNSSATAVALDWRVPLGSTRQSLRAEAKFTQPVLGKKASDALTGKQAGKLKGSLHATNDAAFSVTYAPVSALLGRSIAPFRQMFVTLIPPIEPTTELSQVLAAIPAADTPFAKMEPDPTKRAAMILAVETAGAGLAKSRAEIVPSVKAFQQLLSNQPQLYGSITRDERKDLVGPQEWVAAATYEYPFGGNLSRFLSASPECAPALNESLSESAAGACRTKLTSIATTRKRTDRLALSAEYHRIGALNIDLPQYSLTTTVPAGHMVVASVTYGRALPLGRLAADGRLDTRAEYQDASNNPQQHDRFVASITYTTKINDSFSFPVSILYANHAQYLSTVDRKLNVHFGLSFKLPDKKG
jgi:hypothetical protein